MFSINNISIAFSITQLMNMIACFTTTKTMTYPQGSNILGNPLLSVTQRKNLFVDVSLLCWLMLCFWLVWCKGEHPIWIPLFLLIPCDVCCGLFSYFELLNWNRCFWAYMVLMYISEWILRVSYRLHWRQSVRRRMNCIFQCESMLLRCNVRSK